MKIFITKEADPKETRVAMVPSVAKKFAELGAELEIESDLGVALHFTNEDYEKAGAKISQDREKSMKEADMVLRLGKPSAEDIQLLKEGCIHASYLEPFFDKDTLNKLAAQKVTSISMEMMPRTTLAQKMDSLSSQASLGGYVAVILAAERTKQIFPMMITPAGTISPARVFILGAGVAGLQAIATAKRLGARVEAYDTRPDVEDQIKSLGAKFVKIDLGQTEEAAGGYAKALTEDQIKRQREALAKICARMDIVISTAQLFGREAPLLITEEAVKGMKAGSVLVDLAVETGGNIKGSKLDEEVDVNGVTIIGLGNLPGRVPVDSSTMYACNLYNMVSHFWNKNTKSFELKNDEILIGNKEKKIEGCVIVYKGEIISAWLRGKHGMDPLKEEVKFDPPKEEKKEKPAEEKKEESKEEKKD